ncbi:MAG: hypothetical protein KGJ68_11950, partial [Gammaproteobacteria bacterium]|nr:hypothetical protein [Gammaproteobacteria bacterium]
QEARRECAELHERRDRGVEVTGDVEGRLQLSALPKNRTDNKKPIPGSSGDGFLVPLNRLSRGEKKPAVSPPRYEVRHHRRVLTGRCDMSGRVSLRPILGVKVEDGRSSETRALRQAARLIGHGLISNLR